MKIITRGIRERLEALNTDNSNVDLEDYVYLLHRCVDFPVRVSRESWDGMEIRLTRQGETKFFDCKHIRINVNDTDVICKIIDVLGDVDEHLVNIVNKVCFSEQLSFPGVVLEARDPDEIITRWEKFINWVKINYPQFDEKNSERKWGWWNHPRKGVDPNLICWAARVILGGIQPSEIGLTLLKQGKADIGESGLLTLKSEFGKTRWHFGAGRYEFDSFGLGCIVDVAIQKAFSNDKDVIVTNKIPEQWEIDTNVYIGIEAPKKPGIFSSKK